MEVTLDIQQDQLDRLDELQQERKASREQLVREALAAYLPPSKKKHLLEYFGVLKGRVEDGMAFQDRIRREWDRAE